LARAVTSTDALSRYMHDEMCADEAAFEIAEAARLAGKTPSEMFALLKQRYEAEMASYNLQTVRLQEHGASAYALRETTDELSERYLK